MTEIAINIASGVEHIDDLDGIAGIAEKYDIVLIRHAAQVRAQFGAGLP
jgi:hypothetical protein